MCLRKGVKRGQGRSEFVQKASLYRGQTDEVSRASCH